MDPEGKELNSDVATGSWKVSRPLGSIPGFLRELFALPPACSSLQGVFPLVPKGTQGGRTSHLLQVPLGRGGIIWGLLGNPWQLRPCNFGRAVAGPPQAERLGENSIPLAASIFHESSFLFLRPHKHVHSPAPGSSLLNHSTALVMKRVGTSL